MTSRAARRPAAWRTRIVRLAADPRLPLAVLLAMAAAVFFILMRYAALADFRELALDRLQDDSFYYLQPAWDFASRGFFTFDGENPSYGFQPLWMLVLTFQAAFVPDKVALLRAAVGLGGLFYSLTGLGLYFLTRRWMGAWSALLAPAIWLLNPGLAGLYITGKENALYAFLLVMSAVLMARRLRRPVPPRGAWVDGIVLGLLVLSRVNALVVALLFAGALLLFSPGDWGDRARRIGWLALGAGAVLLPWGAYAQFAFGTIFPNSGTAKLYGSLAALAVFIDNHAGWLTLDQIAAWLPPGERIFLGNSDALVLPTRGLAESFFLGYLPETTLGALARLWPFAIRNAYRLRLILLGLGGSGFVAWALTSILRGLRRRASLVGLPRMDEAGSAALAVAVLTVSGLVNGTSNLMLLPAYLYWGSWYAVPEQMTLVLAAATMLWLAARLSAAGLRLALDAIASRARKPTPSLGWLDGVGVAVLVAGSALLGHALDRAWRPAPYTPSPTSVAAYNGVRWMNLNLPRGARVASYSSGLIGYLAEGYVVVNIDGLANTPRFVENEVRGHLLFLRGLADQDPLIEYLERAEITHLANAEPEARIVSGPYLGLAALAESRLLYKSPEGIDWGPGEPARRFIVVELSPASP